jgi:hypothetical protein
VIASPPVGVFARRPTQRPSLLDQFRDVRLHPQIEGRIARALLGQEVEKIPLRHHCNEGALRRQMGEVGNLQAGRSDGGANVVHFSVWELEEFLQQTELVHEFERRRMDRVTAKIAQKILMLL